MIFAVWKKKNFITFIIILLAIIILLLSVNFSSAHSVFYKTKKQLPIYCVKNVDKKIAISFDCAWGVDYTDSLLQIMEEEKVKYTFFCVEFWTKKHPDYIKKISDFGHEIGTHSTTHPYMSKLSKLQIQKELTSSKEEIEKITEKKVELFRAPYGDYNDLVINTATELGLFTIQWDVDSLDWKDLSKDQIISRVTKKVKSGSIVLFHNQGLNTANALRPIIQTLKKEGYTFVPIGQLIYRENYYITANGEQVLNS